MIRVYSVERFSVLAYLDLDLRFVIIRVDHLCRDLAANDSIKTEAAKDTASNQIAFRREVRPSTQEWNEVYYSKSDSANYRVNEQEDWERNGELSTVYGANPD